MTNDYLTPAEYAKQRGVAVDKVLYWIHTNQLGAINLAQRPDGRPRFRIPLAEIRRFEESRSTKPPIPKQPRRRRREMATAGKEYF
jgi:hypothetical protein